MPLRADGGARRDALEAIAVEAADTGEGVVGVPRDGEVRDLGPAGAHQHATSGDESRPHSGADGDVGAQVFSAQLGDDVYGMVRGGYTGIEIYVDSDNPHVRQRFTVAHEVGHIVAVKGSLDASVSFVKRRSDSGAGSADEIYANEFAASLLMPEDEVKNAFAENSNVFHLASLFDVSVSAMGWRLRHLSLAG